MKTVFKTIILMIIIFVGLFIGYKIYNKSVDESSDDVLDIAISDPTVTLLMNKIYSSDIFRKGSFSSKDLNENAIIHYAIDNLTKENYTQKNIKHKKSLCEVTGKILFTSTHNCNIRIIKNEYFTNIIKNDFNVDIDLSYDTFDYAGYYCKNDGKKYYCLLSDYTSYDKHLSVLKNAYEEGNKLIIYEYYLYVDINNTQLCNLYLNAEYCNKKNPYADLVVDDDVVKNNGALYRHEFIKEEAKYYYLQSFIVSER